MSKHTPGPWEVANTRVSPFYAGLIAFVENNPDRALSVIADSGRPAVETEANAHLIAAAPDLLVALRETNRRLNAAWLMGELPASVIPKELVEKTLAAIAKAEGK